MTLYLFYKYGIIKETGEIMKARKGILSIGNVANATGRGKRYVDNILLTAKKLSSDLERDKRLDECLCLSCYYLPGSRFGGASITTRDCASCDKTMNFSSTATDLLCKPCAKENTLCLRCGADIDLKVRRKPYPFQEK
jgi:hypothetical protein